MVAPFFSWASAVATMSALTGNCFVVQYAVPVVPWSEHPQVTSEVGQFSVAAKMKRNIKCMLDCSQNIISLVTNTFIMKQ